MDCIDYRFTDGFCDRPESTQEYSERLVRLPTFFNSLAKQEILNAPVAPAPPMVAKGHVTFGRCEPLIAWNAKPTSLPCGGAIEAARVLTYWTMRSFNNLMKHSEKTRACWGKVLQL